MIKNYLEEYITAKGASEELKIVKKSIDKLSVDIVNLFDLESLNKGLAIYNHDLVSNFSEILGENLVLFRHYAGKWDIQIVDNIEGNIFIKADPGAVNRIVNNLVENAIKFSRGGTIEVSLTTRDDKIFFSVKDQGIGIPPELHKKVFEPYYQITNQKRSVQGMGLGLPIIKKVITDLNGEIKIDSDPAKESGTRICVTLTKHMHSEQETVSASLPGNDLLTFFEDTVPEDVPFEESKETILLVEDNVAMVNYLLKKLRVTYNVYGALNGSDAIKKIKNLNVLPDLIITDVMMDKVDGYSLAKIISNDPEYGHIPFIFLSAKSGRSERLRGLKLGAIDFIQKPFSMKELIQKIESILENVRKQKTMLMSTAFMTQRLVEKSKPESGLVKFDQNCQLYNLTNREKEVARYISEGRTYREIGEVLFIAERTVTKHVQNIFEKTAVSNKIELIKKLEK